MKTDKKDGEYGSKTPENFTENTRKFIRTPKKAGDMELEMMNEMKYIL